MIGRVVLVGAGPGDPDLLTLRAARELARAEVLLYDALIEPELLDLVPEACERIDVGKRGDGTRGVALDDIVELMLEKARAGRNVVRLKGGDPFLFGRGGEEATALAAAGIPFEVVPGIPSALAVPAYAGIPVTDRRLSSSFAVVTGHRGVRAGDLRTDWEGLSSSAETLVVLMATRWLEEIVERILAGGRDPATPAAMIAHGTTPRQRVVSAPLAELPKRVREAGLQAPTVLVVGEVVRFRESIAWFEKRPLFGRRVLVTRAIEQAGELAKHLLAGGAAPIRVPLLAFAPPADPQPLACAFDALDRYDWLVYTSATAVRFATPARRPPGTRVACIGAATAAAAAAARLPVHAAPAGESTPEQLAAAMAAAGRLEGARVLLPCALGARDALARALEVRGASVDRVTAYATEIPAAAAADLTRELEASLDAVTFTSPSTVEHLFQILGPQAGLELSRAAVFACIGPTTAAALVAHGVEGAVVAEAQTSEDLVRALERRFAEPPHGLS